MTRIIKYGVSCLIAMTIIALVGVYFYVHSTDGKSVEDGTAMAPSVKNRNK